MGRGEIGHWQGASIVSQKVELDGVTSVDPGSYRALFGHSSEAMVILRGGKIADANQAARDMLGLTGDDLSSTIWSDLFADEHVLDVLERMLDADGSVAGFEARIRMGSGPNLDCRLAASVLHDRDGADEVRAIVIRPAEAVYPDDSSEEGVHRQMSDSPSTETSPADSIMTNHEFLPHVFHELRTPLNAILGFAHLLKESAFGDLSSRQERFTDNILTSGMRLNELITDAGDLWKAEAGLLELDLAPIDIGACVASCIAEIVENDSEAAISFGAELPDGFAIQGDESRIRQAVNCLLDAALQLSGAKNPLEVSLSLVDDELRFAIHNAGEGVREDYWEAIGAMFVRGYSGEAKRFARPGLRLPLAKKLAELHGGTVSAGGAGGEHSLMFALPASRSTDAAQGHDADAR